MQTLDVVRSHPENFRVSVMTAHRQMSKLLAAIQEFHPEFVVVSDAEQATELRRQITQPLEIGIGLEGLVAAASWPGTTMVVNALVGAVGIRPTIEALQSGKDVALANKETLVAAGDLVWSAANKGNSRVIPIDSEHSAILQCLLGNDIHRVEKLVLTASGGPFRGYSQAALEQVRVEDALAHPTWKMGAKITVDSATLMNKGFEVIEAHHLYHMSYDQIEVLVHPQSIIHSMVYYVDGAVMAQLGSADMRIPIQFALFGGAERMESAWNRLDLAALGALTFATPDTIAFPALTLAYECGRRGGTYPAVMNAANEVAASAFLSGQLPFFRIVPIVEKVVELHHHIPVPTLSEVLDMDSWARMEAANLMKERGAHS